MTNASGTELARQMEEMREELKELRREVGGLATRLARLEVREELVESPDAAGDEPVRR